MWALLRSTLEGRMLEGPDAGAGDARSFLASSSPQQSPRAPLGPRGSPAGTSGRPAPRAASEEELNLVRTCLQRWTDEVEQDVQGWPQMSFGSRVKSIW